VKDNLNIAAAQQEESSLQRRVEASVLIPWEISSNQLSHIPNNIFFESIFISHSYSLLSSFYGKYSEYTTPCMTMVYATLDALTGHALATTYPTLGGYGPAQMSG
jgi:hypothetical protein